MKKIEMKGKIIKMRYSGFDLEISKANYDRLIKEGHSGMEIAMALYYKNLKKEKLGD